MTDNKVIIEDLASIYTSGIDWDCFDDKTILISGANGFLPAYMVESLLYADLKAKRNLKVIALVRNKKKAEKRFQHYLNNKKLEFIQQDVCEKVAYQSKIDYIIHAASQASPKYYGTDPVGTLDANVTGTMNMLRLAANNNVEAFLYFSSAEVYGQILNDSEPIDEDSYGYLDPTSVRACYAESKRMGENMCVSFAQQFGVKAKIVRPFHTFGPGMDLADGRVFVDFIADVVAGSNILMKSDGSAKRAYCYISDAVAAYFKVLLNGRIAKPYNVGNPYNELSVSELADMLVDMADANLKVVRSSDNNYLPSKVNRIIPCIERIRKLGWTPQTSAYDGFHRTIMSYKNNYNEGI